jgi:DNA-binding response OmpR family regulator
VLLVDDEEGLRLMGQRILERDGFRVFTAADGEEALELFRRESAAIGLVILDLTMPRLDGVQTCRALKRLQANLRVVISSGFSEEQARDQIPDNGIAGFLQKPYTVDTLVSMVRTHLPMAQ